MHHHGASRAPELVFYFLRLLLAVVLKDEYTNRSGAFRPVWSFDRGTHNNFRSVRLLAATTNYDTVRE